MDLTRSVSVDYELEQIIERMADRMVKFHKDRARTRGECCSASITSGRPVVEVMGLDEIKKIANKCKIVFVNAYTTYCPYCRMFHPVFEYVAEKYKGKAGFVKVNLDYAMDVAYAFYIMGTPTTIVLVNGKPVDRIMGYVDEYELEAYVEELLKREGCS